MENKKEQRFYVGHIPTETQPTIIDRENEDEHGNPQQYSIYEILAQIKNDIEELKKSIGN